MIQHLTVLASNEPHTTLLQQRLAPETTIAFDDRVALSDRLLELAAVLPRRPRTLDFVGLTSHDKMLAFHNRPLDTGVKRVRSFFRGLAEEGVLAALGITALRLIGCSTGVGERARATISTLADITGLDVTGTQDLVSVDDITADGVATPARAWGVGTLLDLDALRPEALDQGARVVDQRRGREILAHVRRNAGIAVPFLLAVPHAAIALPSVTYGHYHHLEILLDHELVRANIRGASVVFPVDDPRSLRALLES